VLAGFGFGVAVFAHVVVRGLGDLEVRRRLWREAGAQIAIVVAAAIAVAVMVDKVPVVRLGRDLLPRIVWERNDATIVLCASLVFGWIVSSAWPPGGGVLERMGEVLGPEVRTAKVGGARLHQLRTLGPLLLVSLVWTVALLGAAWVGLQALSTRASDPARLALTAVVAGFVVILPALPLLGVWAWHIADRIGRAHEPALRARDVLEKHPGEVLGLALCALPGALPVTQLLWRPFSASAASLMRRLRVDGDLPLPDGLKADPIADLRTQLALGLALVRTGTTSEPPRGGRVLQLLWAPALITAAARAALSDPVDGKRARRTLALQWVAFVAVSALWLALFGFDIEDEELRWGRATFTVGFGSSFMVALFSLLHLSEAIVIALTREHHDAIGARAARLLGVPPDEDVPDPRVRLDRAWLWRRFKRRAQGAVILVASALPWVVVAFLVTVPVVKLLEDAVIVGWFLRVFVGAVGDAVVLCFALYWGAVFLIGKTSHAWSVATTREPFFIERLAHLAARNPRAAWPVAVYLWVVRKTLGVVPRPAALMERMPYAAIGLALVRVTCVIPGVYLVLRPFLPVGATLLLKHRAPEALVAAAAQAALPAPDASAASGHEA
jgi:hypothetical protein